MSPQGVMSSKQANNNPGLCPVKKKIIGVVQGRTVWSGHVTPVGGENKMHTGFSLGKMQERGHLEDLDIDGKIIL